jgi:hypothetical protein
VVLCPDVAPVVDRRFDCCDLLRRSVIHHGAHRASATLEHQRLDSEVRKNVQLDGMCAERPASQNHFERLSVTSHCILCLTQQVPDHQVPTIETEYYWSKYRK